MIKRMEENRKATDIYIKPDISDFTVVSFEEGAEIIHEGEIAALKILDTLQQLGGGIPVKREMTPVVDTLNIEQIRVHGIKNYTRSYVIGKLNFKPGSKITYEKLNSGLSALNATQNFTAISYCFDPGEKPGAEILTVTVKENPINRYLKFGLHYDPLYKSAVLVNLTQKKFLFNNDVASADVILGDNFRYNFDYYLDNGFYMSYGLHSHYYTFNRNISADFTSGSLGEVLGVDNMNIDFKDFTNQLYIQTIFARSFLVGGGLEHRHVKIKSSTLPGVNPIFDNSDYLSVYGYLKFDSYDDKFFPTEGYFFRGEAKSVFYSSDYTNEFERFLMIKGEIGTAKTIFDHATIIFKSETGMIFTDNSVPAFDFVLGGYGFYQNGNFRHMYGYDYLSLNGNSYIKGSLTADYEFYKRNHLNFTANYANIGQNLYEDGKMFGIPAYSGYAFGYGMETIIGPIEIKHSWSPETRKHFTWVSLGFWF